MKCAKCGSTIISCIDSRESGETIRRRRKCLDCGYRFSTFEIILDDYQELKRKEAFLENVIRRINKLANMVNEGGTVNAETN